MGGIGAGSFQYMTDGAFSHAMLSGNYDLPTGDLPGCFAAVRTRTGDRIQARVLALKSEYGLPVVTKLDFDGLYPQANLSFPENDLPVSVHLKGFSPIIPHDLKNSCYPAAAFIFRLENQTKLPVEVSVALSWENLLGIGSSHGRPFRNRTGDIVAPVPDNGGLFAIKMRGPASLDPFGMEFQQENSTGDLCLMAAPDQPQAIVTTAGWNALDAKPEWWELFTKEGTVAGSAQEGVQNQTHPAGVISVKIVLKPREIVQIPFAFAWNFPHLFTQRGKDFGRYYQRLYPNSYASAKSLLSDWRSLLTLTAEWQNRLAYSDLPVWLVRKITNSASPLTSHSLYTKNGGFLLLDSTENASSPDTMDQNDSTLFQRIGTKFATSSFASHSLLLDLFPELANLRLRQWIAQKSIVNPAGANLESLDEALPNQADDQSLSNVDINAEGPPPPLTTRSEFDNASFFLIEMAQYVRETGDEEFLERSYPSVRSVANSLLQSVNSSGLPNTAEAHASTVILLLASLRSAEELSSVQSHPLPDGVRLPSGIAALGVIIKRNQERNDRLTLAKACNTLREKMQKAVNTTYWDGKNYGRKVRSSTGAARFIYEPDALIGQWASDILGFGLALSPENVLSALNASPLFTDNPSASARIPEEKGFIDGGLKSKDFPPSKTDVPGKFLVQGLLKIVHGKQDSGVNFLKQEDSLALTRFATPWSSPIASRTSSGKFDGVRSLAHAVSWNALEALEGFNADLLRGELHLVPQIPGAWRTLRAPLFTPTFWGGLEYKPSAKGGVATFRLDRLFALPSETPSRKFSVKAILNLNSIWIPGPPPRPAGSALVPLSVPHVSLGRAPIGVKFVTERDGSIRLTFETPISMSAGDRLEIDLH